jgi:methionine salvage enolase-phosphatase E1
MESRYAEDQADHTSIGGIEIRLSTRARVFLDDDTLNVEAAKRVGMKALLRDTPGLAAWLRTVRL